MQKRLPYILILGLLIALLLVQKTFRFEHAKLFTFYGFATFFYLLIVKYSRGFGIKNIILIATFIRIPFIFLTPNLSDDYYRFIWDGHLVANFKNPFENVPSETNLDNLPTKQFLKQHVYRNSDDLYFKDGIGHYSKKNPTVYPLINQIFFAIAASIGKDNLFLNVVILKLILLVFEILLIQLIVKLLKWLKKPPEWVTFYAFNPLVILEIVGNIHFEGVTLYFMLLGIWYLHKHKWFAGVIYTLGIGVKLLPLLALPLFFKRLKTKELLIFYGSIGLLTFLMFTPFATTNLNTSFGDGIRLYFNKFEFNASIYYIERAISEQFAGFNAMSILGIINGAIVFISVILMALYNKQKLLKQVFPLILFAFTTYYLFASIVHPWYIIYSLVFSLLSGYLYGIIWSILTFTSYFAYQQNEVIEPIWLTTFSYIIVLLVAILEIRSPKKLNLEWLVK